jgi:hypothetical protein
LEFPIQEQIESAVLVSSVVQLLIKENAIAIMSPKFQIDTDVETGREDVWEMMKGTFKDEIRRAKMRGIGMGVVNVLVQPVMMGWQWGGDGEEDEFEL